MIELYLDNQKVVLPADLSFQLMEENPLISAKGTYTLDLEISLESNVNAKIFKHINRLNLSEVDTDFDALLIRNRRKITGTAIVMDHTDKKVNIQIVSDNSELNYIAKSETKIWKLDFGTETEDEAEPSGISYATALNTIENPSWENNFVCAPVKIEGETDFANKWELPTALSGYHIQFGELFNTTSTNNFVIQPYLMYYINKLPSLLGYTLVENDLENDARAVMMYIPNARRSFKYSDFLPDWTVGEFITYVEEFFNVFFLVDSAKNLYIKNIDDFITGANIFPLTDVFDKFTREHEKNAPARLKASNFSYDKTDKTAYFRYAKIPDDILEKCTQNNWTGLSILINFINASEKDKFVRNRTLASLEDYIYSDAAEMNLLRYIPANGTGLLNYVNKFRNYNTNTEGVNLKIVPATMDYTTIEGELTNGVNIIETVTAPFQLPYVRKSTNVPGGSNLLESIEDGEAGEQYIDRPSLMEVALFNGMIKLFTKATNWELNNIMYPYPFVDNKPEHGAISNADLSDFYTWITAEYDDVCSETLRLVGTGGVVEDYYSNNYIDVSFVYEFVLRDNSNLHVGNIFEYQNRKYIALSFERSVTGKTTNKPVLGKFYRLTI